MTHRSPRIRLLRLRDERDGCRWTMLRAGGELDLLAADRLAAAFAAASYSPGLIVDLTETTFIDCGGLRALVEGLWDADRRGCRVHIISSPAVDRLVGLLGGWSDLGCATSRTTLSAAHY